MPPTCAAALESGYAQSKLVAEHRLASAAADGRIRLHIGRLGLIGAPSATAVKSSRLSERRDWSPALMEPEEPLSS